MNKRIRYTKETDGSFKGTKFYKSSTGEEHTVSWVNGEGFCTATIINLGTSEMFPVKAASPHKIKIAIKKKLMDLGCEFEAETRTVSETE